MTEPEQVHGHDPADSVLCATAVPAEYTAMNRQKKLQQLFKAKAKKASAKLAPKNRNTYVSKADRLKLAQVNELENVVAASPTSEFI
ncbi:hypothetical protein AYO28_00125 [Pseudomonas putida]|uniref:DUF2986 domain-containing protein n=2 Tax=Pseudomonas putida TaxID=303 RepID=A0A177SCE6_PSEPU|nr:hypothetical protein AYO28_00125 [Pseudomonas putida]